MHSNTFIGLSYPFKGRLSWAAQTRYEIEHIFALLLGRTGVSFLTHQMALLIFKFASWKSDYQYHTLIHFLRLNFNYLTKLLNVLNLSWTLMSKFIPHTFVEKFFFWPLTMTHTMGSIFFWSFNSLSLFCNNSRTCIQ